jgi:hypothetical protein
MKSKKVMFSVYLEGELNKELAEWAKEESKRLGISLSKNDLIGRILFQAVERKKYGKADEKGEDQSKKNTELKPIDLFSNKFERSNGNGKRMGVMTDSVAIV